MLELVLLYSSVHNNAEKITGYVVVIVAVEYSAGVVKLRRFLCDLHHCINNGALVCLAEAKAIHGLFCAAIRSRGAAPAKEAEEAGPT